VQQIIHAPQDLTHLSWSLVRGSSGTAGSFLKAQDTTYEGKIYYKLSDYDPFHGVTGHESVNEIIADRLLTILDIPHVSYQLIHADIVVDGKPLRTWLCASRNFRHRGEKKEALDAYYESHRQPGESPLSFCIRCGWSDYVYQMLVIDYLILNRDRHGANLEVLTDRYKKTVRLAPLFDHGVSLFCRCRTIEELQREDVLADKPVQCFVGSRSAWENLRLIPRDQFPDLSPLMEHDRNTLLEGLDEALEKPWLDMIWEMIWRRWQKLETFRTQR